MILLVGAMMVATWFLGWWGVVPVAAVVGWMLAGRRTVWWRAALAAALAWAILLALDVRDGRFVSVAREMGAVFGMPAVVPLVVTLALAALLAGSAAVLAASLRESTRRDSPRHQAIP